jgi:hypothetical protein
VLICCVAVCTLFWGFVGLFGGAQNTGFDHTQRLFGVRGGSRRQGEGERRWWGGSRSSRRWWGREKDAFGCRFAPFVLCFEVGYELSHLQLELWVGLSRRWRWVVGVGIGRLFAAAKEGSGERMPCKEGWLQYPGSERIHRHNTPNVPAGFGGNCQTPA